MNPLRWNVSKWCEANCNTIDNLKARLRSDHQFGDTSGVLVWQAAEPAIDTSYGEPLSINGNSTETWAVIRFEVTQMIQA